MSTFDQLTNERIAAFVRGVHTYWQRIAMCIEIEYDDVVAATKGGESAESKTLMETLVAMMIARRTPMNTLREALIALSLGAYATPEYGFGTAVAHTPLPPRAPSPPHVVEVMPKYARAAGIPEKLYGWHNAKRLDLERALGSCWKMVAAEYAIDPRAVAGGVMGGEMAGGVVLVGKLLTDVGLAGATVDDLIIKLTRVFLANDEPAAENALKVIAVRVN